MTEVFVKKVGAAWQLWISSRCGDSPAGPRLEKGGTRSFPMPPEFIYQHSEPKPAYAEAERLQAYLSELKLK